MPFRHGLLFFETYLIEEVLSSQIMLFIKIGSVSMILQFVPYMTAAVAAHALLTSLGALLAVHTVRALAQGQTELWEAYLDAQSRNVPIIDVPARIKEIETIKKVIAILIGVNTFVGSFGIGISPVAIAFLSDSPGALNTVCLSLMLIMFQLAVFMFTVPSVMRFVGLWIQKAPYVGQRESPS